MYENINLSDMCALNIFISNKDFKYNALSERDCNEVEISKDGKIFISTAL
jgi:hypothetical protein